MISSKSLKYTVRILLGILLGVYLGIIVLLNIPYVQDKLSYIVTKELRKVLNTEVSVGKNRHGPAEPHYCGRCVAGRPPGQGNAESGASVCQI